jgi:predicted transcriptional regulator
VLIILANGKAKYQLLADQLKLSHSTLSSYLKYLVSNNILVKDKIGYENLYTIRDEDRVAKVLTAYKPSFLDRLVDNALDIWMETHFHKEEPWCCPMVLISPGRNAWYWRLRTSRQNLFFKRTR